MIQWVIMLLPHQAMALRAASSLAPSLRVLAAQRSSAAFITTSARPMDIYKDKEMGDEQIHFRKEDERLMRQLLEKVKAAADKVCLGAWVLCLGCADMALQAKAVSFRQHP